MKSSRGFLENGVKVFVLFFCGAHLVLRSSVLTVLDLVVDATHVCRDLKVVAVWKERWFC